jgi:hypothetical protein
MSQSSISNIYDFNEEKLQKIKSLIDNKKITKLSELDELINPRSFNTNIDGTVINELSINASEFKKIQKKSLDERNKLLNLILPEVCIVHNEVEKEDIDKLIPLINSKIETIIEML